MYCKVCGKKLPDDALRCDACGAPTGAEYENGPDEERTSSYYNRDGRGGSYGSGSYGDEGRYGNGGGYNPRPDGRRGFAIASLVLGIVGVVCTCCSMATMGLLSVALGITGLVFGILGLKSRSRGLAVAGIVLGAVNILLGVLLMFFMISYIGFYGEMYGW